MVNKTVLKILYSFTITALILVTNAVVVPAYAIEPGQIIPIPGTESGSADCVPGGDKYCLLEPIGGVKEVVSGSDKGFSDYLQVIITIAIWAAGGLAVLMLIWGGLEYIFSSVSEKMKSDAKERITNALVGLLIAIAGYLILNIINPNILTLSLPEITPIKVPSQPTTPPNPYSGGGTTGGGASGEF